MSFHTITMIPAQRAAIIERHDFVVLQLHSKVIGSFENCSADSQSYGRKLREELENSEIHLSDFQIVELIKDKVIDFEWMLHDVQVSATLGILSVIYQQWEKEIRRFLAREFRTVESDEVIEKRFWKSNFQSILEIFSESGWAVQGQDWYEKIDACRLIVNVHKHGKGVSLGTLIERYPEYISRESKYLSVEDKRCLYDDELLYLESTELTQLCNALRDFWQEFPNQLLVCR